MSTRMLRLVAALLPLTVVACDRDPVGPELAPSAIAARPATSLAPFAPPARDRGTWSVPRFAFLPPIAEAVPASAGDADISLRPEVSVCELAGAGTYYARCVRSVAHFSQTAGTGNQTVRSSGGPGGRFSVDWISSASGVVAGRTYRITVTANRAFVGSAEVVALPNAAGARPGRQGTRATFVAGQTLPIAFRIEKGAVATGGTGPVSADGGSIASSDGNASIAAPAGALPEGGTLSVAPRASAPASSSVVPGTAYEYGPHGTQFSTAVTLTIAYDPARIPAGVRERDLRLFTYVDGAGWQLVDGSSVNPLARTVSGPVWHFSTYAVAGLPPISRIQWNVPLDANRRLEFQVGQPYVQLQGLTTNAVSDGDPRTLQCERVPSYSVADARVARIDSVTYSDQYWMGDPCQDWGYSSASWVAWLTFNTTTTGRTHLRVDMDGVLDSIVVDIAPARIAGVSISPEDFSLTVGQTAAVTGTPQTWWGAPFPDSAVQWSSSDPAVFSVVSTSTHQGRVQAVRGGCARLEGRSGGVSGYTSVVVGPTPPEIVYTPAHLGSRAGLRYVMASGCNPSQFAATDGLYAYEPVWSPDGARIAFMAAASFEASAFQIHLMNADGTGLIALPGTARASNLTWSPDGQQIAFLQNDESGTRTLAFVTNVGGTYKRQVSADAYGDVRIPAVSWSPDSRRLLLTQANGRVIVGADGSNPKLVTLDAELSYRTHVTPQWMPDGSGLLVVTDDMGMWVVGESGGRVRQLFAEPNGIERRPAYFSPDGRKILYGSNGYGGRLVVASIDGTTRTQVAAGGDGTGVDATWARWSPDSQWIAFTRVTHYSYHSVIYRVRSDGSGMTQVVQGGLAFDWKR